MRYEINNGLTKVYTEFSEFVENADKMKDEHRSSCSKRESWDDFYGDALTFEQMMERCYDGYNAKEIGKAHAEFMSIFRSDAEEPYLRVMGEELDVPTFLSGEHKCFWHDDTEKAKPRVHLVFSSNCLGYVEASNFINHGGAIASIVEVLSQQVDIKISCYFSNKDVFTDKGLQVITLKKYDEATDIPRIGVTTHPSFFRRIGFAWFEGLGGFISEPSIRSEYGASRTADERFKVVSDDEFYDWCRIADDEFVVDCPAANKDYFEDEESTLEWIKSSVKNIKDAMDNDEKSVKLF